MYWGSTIRRGLLALAMVLAVSLCFGADHLRPLSPALADLERQLADDPARAGDHPIPDDAASMDADAIRAQIILAAGDTLRGSSAAGLQRLLRAERAARALDAPELLMAVLEALAQHHIEQVRFVEADETITALQSLATRRGMPLWESRALALRGAYWRRKGDYEKALDAHRQALTLREALGDRHGQVQSINAISMLRRRAGELYLALDGHTQALRIAREIDAPDAVAEGLRLVARVYAELDDNEQAERFYNEALVVLGDHPQEARAELLLDLAAIAVQTKRLDYAEQLADEAIAIGERRGADYSGVGYIRRASILAARGQLEPALGWVDRSIAAGQKVDGVRSVLVKRNARLRLLLQLERYSEAVAEGEWVLATAREVGDRLIERDALRDHAEALFGAGDSVRAFESMADYSELNAQVSDSMTSRRIADLESSLKRRALEADLALTAKERDVNLLRAERQRWISIGAGLMGLALFFAVLALRSRILQARATNELLRQQSERLKQASETDPLTGLCNRRGALQALEALQRDGSGIALLLIDIDHFKKINDRYGHAGGDDVLRTVAERLRRAAPTAWTCARWGGEEFLLFGKSSVEAPPSLCARILDAIRSEPIAVGDIALPVTASLGYASIERSDRAAWEALLQRADTALYEAKVGGRNQARVAAEIVTPGD